jgi:ATP-dependent RNA helicase DeaD
MTTFDSLGLQSEVLEAISDMGFVTPTPIQEQAIPTLLTGDQDLVALAQTGTGKTAAFGLPLLTLLDFNQKATQGVVLAPTRELCMQIAKDLNNFSAKMSNVNIVAVYGGASITNQINDLKRGAQIIVATPGRLVDLIDRKKVNLSTVRYAILDEADEMLNMGFKDDLDTILGSTPETKNTWLFSATMPDEVLRISRNYMNNPSEVAVARNQSNENIEHVYYVVQNKDRYLALKRIADFNPDIFAIVFCRTKIETQQVADALIKDGYNADALHGDLSQAQRDHVMNRYRSRNLQMLVATDVAARGIDVNDVTHVINYNLPDEIESYTHRSGRTARAGKKGVSIVLMTSKEVSKVRILERLTKAKFAEEVIPNGMQVCERQLLSLIHRVNAVAVNEEQIEQFLPAIYEEMKDLDKEEIVKRFVSLEFNRFLDYYKNAPDLNMKSGRGERGSGSNSNVSKLFINLGKMDNIDKVFMAEYIADIANVPDSAINWVGIKDIFSFVEVRPEFAQGIVEAFKGQKFKGRPVRVELREGNEGNERRGGGGRGGNDRGGRGDFGRDRRGGSDRNNGRSFNRSGNDRNNDRSFNRGGSNDRPFERRERSNDRPFERSNDRPFERRERSNDRPAFEPRNNDRPQRPAERPASPNPSGNTRRFDFSLNEVLFDDRDFAGGTKAKRPRKEGGFSDNNNSSNDRRNRK